MKRLLIMFVAVDLLLLAGVIVILTGDGSAPQPVVPVPSEVARELPEAELARPPVTEQPVIPVAVPEGRPTEAELEEELRRATERGDVQRVLELQIKLVELRRLSGEDSLREMKKHHDWTVERPEGGETPGANAFRRFRAAAPEVDDNGAAPMPFGRTMFGPWDTGRKAEEP